MNLENIFYFLGIVSFALFITANLFIVGIAIKIYLFAKKQAEIVEAKSQKIANIIDIITSQKTKALVSFATAAVFVLRFIKKAKRF